jgi:hypothetical protein
LTVFTVWTSSKARADVSRERMSDWSFTGGVIGTPYSSRIERRFSS